MAKREITSLPLPKPIQTALQAGGFRYVDELMDIQPIALSKEVNISVEEALSIILMIKDASYDFSICVFLHGSRNVIIPTALDIITKASLPIITFCSKLDSVLGGGIPIGEVTELCGVPGVGKTQLCMQIAIDAQIPSIFKGVGGTALYIDSEGSFLAERIAQMASSVATHIHRIAARSGQPQRLAAAANVTRDALLQGVQYSRVHDQTELIAHLHMLPKYLTANPSIRVVIIDSIAFPFRQDVFDVAARNRTLSNLSQLLHKCAHDFNIAVVLVNHVTTKVDRVKGLSEIVPALGDHWSHCVTNRLMIKWENGVRVATLEKCPSRPMKSATFDITADGARDIRATDDGGELSKRPRIE